MNTKRTSQRQTILRGIVGMTLMLVFAALLPGQTRLSSAHSRSTATPAQSTSTPAWKSPSTPPRPLIVENPFLDPQYGKEAIDPTTTARGPGNARSDGPTRQPGRSPRMLTPPGDAVDRSGQQPRSIPSPREGGNRADISIPRNFSPDQNSRAIVNPNPRPRPLDVPGNPYATDLRRSPVPRPLRWGPMSRWIGPVDASHQTKPSENTAPPQPKKDLELAEHLATALGSPESVVSTANSAGVHEDEMPLSELLRFPKNRNDVSRLRQPERWSVSEEAIGPELISPRLSASAVAVVSDRDDWQETLQLAQRADTSAKVQQVIDHCRMTIVDPASAEHHQDARMLLAWALNRRGEEKAETTGVFEAIEDFTEALEFDPNCWLALHNRGVSYAERGMPRQALRDLNSALALSPGLIAARRNRGELYAELGRYEEAIADFSVGISQDPQRADLLVLRAQTRQHLRQFHLAWEDFSAALRIAGDLPELYVGRANVLAEAEQYGMAVSDLQQALTMDPRHPGAYRSLSLLLSNCPDRRYRDSHRAVYAARQAVRYASPDDGSVLEALAIAFEADGQIEQAAVALEAAIDLLPRERQQQLQSHLSDLRSHPRDGSSEDPNRVIRRASHLESADRR